ncbi:MAG: PilT/PilU family type 4a pilus ATPase, partial [Cyanobium sp. ELA712]
PLEEGSQLGTRAAIPAAPPAPAAPARVNPEPPGTPAEPPANLEAIVQIAFNNNYSDIHLGVGEVPRFRSLGDIVATPWPVTNADTFRDWLREVLNPGQLDSFKRQKEFDGSHSFSFVRVRINLLETVQGPAMVLRLIPKEIPSLSNLGMPSVIKDLAAKPKGMILITGAAGSGITTTLAALIDHINTTMKKHVLTIEDPVEFVYSSKQSLIRQREVGSHTKLFQNALRSALREDPDVILIGEIRDQETLSTAIKAAQTGHLVLGTLHATSAVRTLELVLRMYSHQEQEGMRRAIAETLLGVISQGLIKTTDGKRTAFHDILINTDTCHDYIINGELDKIDALMNRSAFDGMQTANQSLARLVQEGRASTEEVISNSNRPGELEQTLCGST